MADQEKIIFHDPVTDTDSRVTPAGDIPVTLDGETITITPVADTPEFFEDTDFVTGETPTLDFNTALGRNATQGYIANDGPGDFTVAFSTNGTDFGDAITMKRNEVIEFKDISVDSLKIAWVADSAYRVSAI